MLTPQQLGILQHAIGADQYGRRGRGERNYFTTDAGGADGRVCKSLVSLGLMADRGSYGELSGNGNIYVVTGRGIDAVTRESPPPPKTTRSKLRYESFLSWKDAFGGTFRDFLKTEYAK